MRGYLAAAIAAAGAALTLLLAPPADAKELIECPNSKAHVWDRAQCPRLDPFGITGRGGASGGSCGLGCTIDRILGGIGLGGLGPL
jgi:hypothetical protein